MLRRLHTTARLMHTVAHPDDEDGGMLTLESRGHGVSVLQLTLNRGEGGQNKVGSNLFDELGIIRTLELLAADRYYGVEQRFTRVADFGFSKTPEETFEKWGGHDIALGDMVRVIRTFRPDVICTRFQGNFARRARQSSGLGNSDARGVSRRRRSHPLSRADSRRPAALAGEEALHGQRSRHRRLDDQAGNFAVRSVAGRNLRAVWLEGSEASAFAGRGRVDGAGGPRFSYYKLIDSAMPKPPACGSARERFLRRHRHLDAGFGFALGADESKAPWLRAAAASDRQNGG